MNKHTWLSVCHLEGVPQKMFHPTVLLGDWSPIPAPSLILRAFVAYISNFFFLPLAFTLIQLSFSHLIIPIVLWRYNLILIQNNKTSTIHNRQIPSSLGKHYFFIYYIYFRTYQNLTDTILLSEFFWLRTPSSGVPGSRQS